MWCAGLALLGPGERALGQETRTGLEIAGVPAINFDSDEGFGYGVIVELYEYGVGGLPPYVWTLQPTAFFTTEGRRDLTVFFDAPHLLPGRFRLDAYLGREEHIATPYYGLGNESAYDEGLETETDPYFYRYGRTRWVGAVNLQLPVGARGLRLLAGGGAARVDVRAVPEGEGTTLLAEELGAEPYSGGRTHDLRVGVVWDTRDRETGTREGVFTEFLVQRADGAIGSDYEYTRVTFTDRRYHPIGSRLVLAHRVLAQHMTEGAPFHDVSRIQTSFKQQEGLGGARSVRGLPKNRYQGRGLFVSNVELRWRAAEIEAVGRSFHVVLSAFMDAGRVWDGGLRPREALRDLHWGYGGGVRLGMGENFVVALDVGTSRDAGMPVYIGLGYLF